MRRDQGTRRALRFVGWFYVCNAALLSLAATRYFAFAPDPADTLGRVFRILIVPGHFMLLAAPGTLLLGILALGGRPRWVSVASVLFFGLLATLVIVDVRVFALYRFHLNSMVWNLLTSGVAEEILPFSGQTAARAAAIIGALFLTQVALAAVLWRVLARRSRLFGSLVAPVLALVVFAGQALHAYGDASLRASITREMHYLPWLDGLTAKGVLDDLGLLPERAGSLPQLPHGGSGLRYPIAPLACERSAAPLNVLLVLIEEWRFDALDPVTTPAIWRLAERGQRFDHHFSTGNASRYGVFGLMYGLHPSYWDRILAEQRGSLLVEEARRQGHRFLVRGSASLAHPEFDRTVFAALRGEIPLRTPGKSARERDRRITDDLLAFLGEGAQPFFAFLFYDSPHSLDYPDDLEVPYAPVWEEVDHLALHPGFDARPFRNRHNNAVFYVDRLVGEVLARLQELGLEDETVVVVTGDHGEEFNDTKQNFWGHNSNFSRYQTQVPLVVHWPGSAPAVHAGMTSHVDVVPTLMRRVFGCASPPREYSNGFDLFAADRPQFVSVGGGSTGTAVVEPRRVTLVERYAGLRVLDLEWRELPGEPPATGRLRSVLDEMSAFYAR